MEITREDKDLFMHTKLSLLRTLNLLVYKWPEYQVIGSESVNTPPGPSVKLSILFSNGPTANPKTVLEMACKKM